MEIFPTYSESIKNPTLIKLGSNIHVLSFHVMKLLPALHMLKKGMEAGLLTEKSLVVETSSGSFAYGIALASTELNLPFTIVTDGSIDPMLKRQLTNQNGKVIIVKTPKGQGGVQQARLDTLQEILQNTPLSYWPCQYDNPENASAYHDLGVKLVESLGKDVILVGPVGSGGSTGGLIKAMRSYDEGIKLVGVDTFNSVLFGQKDGPRALIGLGNGIMPKNLIHENYDEVHWISAGEAFRATLELHRSRGIFAGPTTGATYKVANLIAKENPHKKIVFVSPDTGHRYTGSVYNKNWIRKHEFFKSEEQFEPRLVTHPEEAATNWSYMDWSRQSLVKILNN